MKLVTTITILTLFLLGILYVSFQELYDVNRTQKSEIEWRIKQNKKETDSLERELKLTKDSLYIAFNTIRQKHEESIKAKAASQREIRKLRDIVYIQYPNDSARVKALQNLYPTFKY